MNAINAGQAEQYFQSDGTRICYFQPIAYDKLQDNKGYRFIITFINKLSTNINA